MWYSNKLYRLTRWLNNGWMRVCPLLLLTACASQPQIQTVKLTPPPALLADNPLPVFTGKTNGDLLDYALDLRDTATACLADKKLLREWAVGGASSGYNAQPSTPAY